MIKNIKSFNPEKYLFLNYLDIFEDALINKNIINIYSKYLRDCKDQILITDNNHAKVYDILIENNEIEAVKHWVNI